MASRGGREFGGFGGLGGRDPYDRALRDVGSYSTLSRDLGRAADYGRRLKEQILAIARLKANSVSERNQRDYAGFTSGFHTMKGRIGGSEGRVLDASIDKLLSRLKDSGGAGIKGGELARILADFKSEVSSLASSLTGVQGDLLKGIVGQIGKAQGAAAKGGLSAVRGSSRKILGSAQGLQSNAMIDDAAKLIAKGMKDAANSLSSPAPKNSVDRVQAEMLAAANAATTLKDKQKALADAQVKLKNIAKSSSGPDRDVLEALVKSTGANLGTLKTSLADQRANRVGLALSNGMSRMTHAIGRVFSVMGPLKRSLDLGHQIFQNFNDRLNRFASAQMAIASERGGYGRQIRGAGINFSNMMTAIGAGRKAGMSDRSVISHQVGMAQQLALARWGEGGLIDKAGRWGISVFSGGRPKTQHELMIDYSKKLNSMKDEQEQLQFLTHVGFRPDQKEYVANYAREADRWEMIKKNPNMIGTLENARILDNQGRYAKIDAATKIERKRQQILDQNAIDDGMIPAIRRKLNPETWLFRDWNVRQRGVRDAKAEMAMEKLTKVLQEQLAEQKKNGGKLNLKGGLSAEDLQALAHFGEADIRNRGENSTTYQIRKAYEKELGIKVDTRDPLEKIYDSLTPITDQIGKWIEQLSDFLGSKSTTLLDSLLGGLDKAKEAAYEIQDFGKVAYDLLKKSKDFFKELMDSPGKAFSKMGNAAGDAVSGMFGLSIPPPPKFNTSSMNRPGLNYIGIASHGGMVAPYYEDSNGNLVIETTDENGKKVWKDAEGKEIPQPKQKFADGGIVGGTSYTGDKVTIGVNSGEAVLNQEQQSNLLSLAKSRGGSVGRGQGATGSDVQKAAEAVVKAVTSSGDKTVSSIDKVAIGTSPASAPVATQTKESQDSKPSAITLEVPNGGMNSVEQRGGSTNGIPVIPEILPVSQPDSEPAVDVPKVVAHKKPITDRSAELEKFFQKNRAKGIGSGGNGVGGWAKILWEGTKGAGNGLLHGLGSISNAVGNGLGGTFNFVGDLLQKPKGSGFWSSLSRGVGKVFSGAGNIVSTPFTAMGRGLQNYADLGYEDEWLKWGDRAANIGVSSLLMAAPVGAPKAIGALGRAGVSAVKKTPKVLSSLSKVSKGKKGLDAAQKAEKVAQVGKNPRLVGKGVTDGISDKVVSRVELPKPANAPQATAGATVEAAEKVAEKTPGLLHRAGAAVGKRIKRGVVHTTHTAEAGVGMAAVGGGYLTNALGAQPPVQEVGNGGEAAPTGADIKEAAETVSAAVKGSGEKIVSSTDKVAAVSFKSTEDLIQQLRAAAKNNDEAKVQELLKVARLDKSSLNMNLLQSEKFQTSDKYANDSIAGALSEHFAVDYAERTGDEFDQEQVNLNSKYIKAWKKLHSNKSKYGMAEDTFGYEKQMQEAIAQKEGRNVASAEVLKDFVEHGYLTDDVAIAKMKHKVKNAKGNENLSEKDITAKAIQAARIEHLKNLTKAELKGYGSKEEAMKLFGSAGITLSAEQMKSWDPEAGKTGPSRIRRGIGFGRSFRRPSRMDKEYWSLRDSYVRRGRMSTLGGTGDALIGAGGFDTGDRNGGSKPSSKSISKRQLSAEAGRLQRILEQEEALRKSRNSSATAEEERRLYDSVNGKDTIQDKDGKIVSKNEFIRRREEQAKAAGIRTDAKWRVAERRKYDNFMQKKDVLEERKSTARILAGDKSGESIEDRNDRIWKETMGKDVVGKDGQDVSKQEYLDNIKKRLIKTGKYGSMTTQKPDVAGSAANRFEEYMAEQGQLYDDYSAYKKTRARSKKRQQALNQNAIDSGSAKESISGMSGMSDKEATAQNDAIKALKEHESAVVQATEQIKANVSAGNTAAESAKEANSSAASGVQQVTINMGGTTVNQHIKGVVPMDEAGMKRGTASGADEIKDTVAEAFVGAMKSKSTF